MMSARAGAGVRFQPENAALAASMADTTSDLFERWNTPTTSAVFAGLRLSNVALPEDSTHSPPTKFLKTSVTYSSLRGPLLGRWPQEIIGLGYPGPIATIYCGVPILARCDDEAIGKG